MVLSCGFIPQKRDFFLLRKSNYGRVGIVHSIDGDKITILEAIGRGVASDKSFNSEHTGISKSFVYAARYALPIGHTL